MISGPLEAIDAGQIEDLVDLRAPESRTLEFKRELPSTEEGHRRFLETVSAFANTAGGDFVFGIEDEEGSAKRISPLAGDPDIAQRQLQQRIHHRIEPRITPLVECKAIPVGGGFVLVLRVPRSATAPNMVTGRALPFFVRVSGGKQPMDVHQLRDSFLGHEVLADRIRRFRLERCSLVERGEGPVALAHSGFMLLHVIPVAAFMPACAIDPGILSEAANDLQTFLGHSYQSRHNLDGILKWYHNADAPNTTEAYTQVFGSGIVEHALTISTEHQFLPQPVYDQMIVAAARSSVKFFRSAGIAPPAWFFLTFQGIKGFKFKFSDPRGFSSESDQSVDRHVLRINECIVDDFDTDAATVIQPALNSFWNSVGNRRCHSYTPDGLWRYD